MIEIAPPGAWLCLSINFILFFCCVCDDRPLLCQVWWPCRP